MYKMVVFKQRCSNLSNPHQLDFPLEMLDLMAEFAGLKVERFKRKEGIKSIKVLATNKKFKEYLPVYKFLSEAEQDKFRELTDEQNALINEDYVACKAKDEEKTEELRKRFKKTSDQLKRMVQAIKDDPFDYIPTHYTPAIHPRIDHTYQNWFGELDVGTRFATYWRLTKDKYYKYWKDNDYRNCLWIPNRRGVRLVKARRAWRKKCNDHYAVWRINQKYNPEYMEELLDYFDRSQNFQSPTPNPHESQL